MANEIRVLASLTLRNANQQFSNNPSSFTADMTGKGGPTPGYLLASKFGTAVNLTQLTYPGGMCVITNVDADDTLIWGVYDLDGTVGNFTPVGELLPGELCVFRLAREIGQQLGTGSGTASVDTGLTLMVKGYGGPCECKVEAFDK